MRILLIKLTSLGDLIHALPALTDAKKANPNIEFDWVIDENFQEIALWHPAVKRHFTTNHRGWRKKLNHLATYTAMSKLIHDIRSTKYDLIIDGQGNHKSALLSLFTKGVRVGFDKDSVREWIAHFAYQKKYPASLSLHAIARLRILFAKALNYPLPQTSPDFGIDIDRFKKPTFKLPEHYVVFVHNASWKTKLWPEKHWMTLIEKTKALGISILLPWGNPEEEARAHRLAVDSNVIVLPRLSLSEIGYILSHSKGAVCVDTGFSHLSAALNIPSITLYGATDAGLIGASGQTQHHLQSSVSCAPCQKKSCQYPNRTHRELNPPCLAAITPEQVFQIFRQMITSSN